MNRDVRRREADELRRLGLPLVLDRATRARGLLRRSAPVLAMIACALIGMTAFERANRLADSYYERTAGGEVELSDPFVTLVSIGTVLILASPVAGLLIHVLVRRVSAVVGDVIGAVLAVVLLLGPVLVFGRTAGPSLPATAAWLLGVLLAGYFGVWTITRWSCRRVVRELSTLGPMVARVLPVLMLAFLFCFYNAEIWQVMVSLSWSRTRWVVLLMLLLAMALAAMTSRDELRTVLAEHHDERGTAGVSTVPLRAAESINLLLIPCLVVLIQAALFATVVFGFFILFGWLSVSEATAAAWTGRPAQRFEGVLANVPISPTLVKVSLTLAAFAALNLVASSGTDRHHRQEYVEPLLEEIVHSLAVRDAYLARRDVE